MSTDNAPPPAGSKWCIVLHWLIKVAPEDWPHLSFIASLLHHAIERPGLTERQARYAQRILEQVLTDLEERGALPPHTPALLEMTPRGRA